MSATIELQNNWQSLRRLTGLTQKEFEQVYDCFEKELKNYQAQFTFEGVPRVRRVSLRKNNIFADSRDALLFLLYYSKGNVHQAELASLFGIDQPKVSHFIHFFQRIFLQMIDNHPHAFSKRNKERILKK